MTLSKACLWLTSPQPYVWRWCNTLRSCRATRHRRAAMSGPMMMAVPPMTEVCATVRTAFSFASARVVQQLTGAEPCTRFMLAWQVHKDPQHPITGLRHMCVRVFLGREGTPVLGAPGMRAVGAGGHTGQPRSHDRCAPRRVLARPQRPRLHCLPPGGSDVSNS